MKKSILAVIVALATVGTAQAQTFPISSSAVKDQHFGRKIDGAVFLKTDAVATTRKDKAMGAVVKDQHYADIKEGNAYTGKKGTPSSLFAPDARPAAFVNSQKLKSGNPTPVNATEYRESVSANQAAAAGNPTPVNATEYREGVSANQAAAAGNPTPVNATEYREDVNSTVAGQGLTGDNQIRTTSQTSALATAQKQSVVEQAINANTASAQQTSDRASQNAGAIVNNSQRIDTADQNIAANKAAAKVANDRASLNSAAIANHETRIEGLEQSTTSKFADLNKQVDDNRKRASAGIAGVAAMANIPQVTNTQSFSVGAGVGNTDGESALAVGASARVAENWVVKGSVSNDTQHNFVVGTGVSYGW